MIRLACRLLVLVALLAPQLSRAVQPDEMMSDPALEDRARTLSQQLRCMVCQNQSIDDSDAPLARDLRLLVRERIARGESDAQVIDFLTARYGAFVLLKPPFNAHTWLLWLVPPLALAIAALVLLRRGRWRTASASGSDGLEPEPLTADERARLARLDAEPNASPPN